MEQSEKISFLSELLIVTNPHLYISHFSSSFEQLDSDCAEKDILNLLIQNGDEAEICRQMFSQNETPVIMTDRFGMVFASVSSRGHDLYLLGPVFPGDHTFQHAEKIIYDLHLEDEENRDALHFIHQIPTMGAIQLMEYTLMLEKTVNDNSLTISDIRYTGAGAADPVHKDPLLEEAGYHGTYEGEQVMLRMVREGDIHNFEKQMNKMAAMGRRGTLASDQARQLKNLVLVNIVLFSRASIDGGLPSETALSLTDYYFQAVEECRDLSELTNIARTMQKDFVTRVHNVKTNLTYSKPVQACCEYITMHLEEQILLRDMARSIGYTEYYLSRKFKAETGSALSEYIRKKRLERARFLLKTTRLSINQISDRLQFNSQSYFTENFRKTYGVTPSEYREKKQVF